MPDQYCFVCASNEGVFLDVTPDNRDTFGDQVKTCFSHKVNESIELSNKICYKCAYELDQCTKFVKKYRKSHETTGSKAIASMSCCFLCYELVESDRIFDITKDNNVIFSPLRKIRSIFNDDINKSNCNSKLICLTCRYNLDVLYDLKRVFQESVSNLKALINGEINYLNFPKIHTDVVNRKTTITTFPDITVYGLVNSDSDSDENMAHSKRRFRGNQHTRGKRGRPRKLGGNAKSKVRSCDECHNTVANDVDMYRFHHTGLTVCKNCWITMDPGIKTQRRSRQTQFAGIKLCTVFLTDVLNQELCKKEKETEKEKDDVSHVTSSDNSQEEIKSESSPAIVSSKMRNHAVNGKARRGRKRRFNVGNRSKDDIESTPTKTTRLSKTRVNVNEEKTAKASSDAEQQSSTQSMKKQSRKRILNDPSSDSDNFLEQKETRESKSNDSVEKSSRKKQKITLEGETPDADSSEESFYENNVNLKSKIRSTTSSSTGSTQKEGDRSTRGRTRSSSISSTEMTVSTKFKSPKSVSQSEGTTKYTCNKCNKKFDNKLSSAKHKLTHFKQAALKLEKLTVPSVMEKRETENDSQDGKISKKTVSFSDSIVSAEKQTDDPEDVAINIEDDTDDEELLSLSNQEDAKIKETSNEEASIVNKSDVLKEECVKESVNDGDAKTKESEQFEEFNVLDETVEMESGDGGKNTEDNNIEKKDAVKDKDETSRNKDSDKSENKDTDIQEIIDDSAKDINMDVEKESNVEIVCSSEKEKSISECNNENNKKDPHEETMQESEMVNLSTQDTTKVDNRYNDNRHNESYENNLENNCEEDEDGREDPELIQCDLTDEFLEKDAKEPEENTQNILSDIVDETIAHESDKTLDDLLILSEDKIEVSEKQQSRSEEESMEVELMKDIDELNSTKDIIQSDLSNGNDKHEEKDDDIAIVPINSNIIDVNEDDDIVPVNNDNNEYREKSEEITEKLITTDDIKEKKKFEEEIKELEKLVEDNAMNNRHELQENSNYLLDNNSADAANEILKEVFELAAVEVQQREESHSTKNLSDVEMETLENISREIRKSADMPSLDPISVMEIDDDNDIVLN
ncbi:hypothetical protein P5V15_013053 [Pogonomyrmex californicus]